MLNEYVVRRTTHTVSERQSVLFKFEYGTAMYDDLQKRGEKFMEENPDCTHAVIYIRKIEK